MRSALLLALAAALAAPALSACGGDETAGTTTTPAPPAPAPPAPDTTTAPAAATIVEVSISGGKPVGGLQRTEVKKGARVLLEIRSDAVGEVHLHGYDVTRRLVPGRASLIAFRATIVGIFELEAHPSHLPVAEIEVRP